MICNSHPETNLSNYRKTLDSSSDGDSYSAA